MSFVDHFLFTSSTSTLFYDMITFFTLAFRLFCKQFIDFFILTLFLLLCS